MLKNDLLLSKRLTLNDGDYTLRNCFAVQSLNTFVRDNVAVFDIVQVDRRANQKFFSLEASADPDNGQVDWLLNFLVKPEKFNRILTFKLFGKPKADINYLG